MSPLRRLLSPLVSSAVNQRAIPRALAWGGCTAVFGAAVIFVAGLHAADTSEEVRPPSTRSPLLRWEAAQAAYSRSGQTANVLRLFQNMREYLRAQGQQNSDAFAKVSLRLAVYQREMGDFAGAAKTSEEGAQVAERLHGPDSQQHFDFLILQTLLLERQQRNDEAEAMGRRVLQRVEPIFGPNANMTGDALETLTIALLNLKKYDEAEIYLRRILAIRQKALGHESYQTGEGWTNLGTYYLEMGKLTEAREALTKGAVIVRAAQAGNVVQTRLVARNLARLALDGGNAAEIAATSDRVFREELKLIKDVLWSLGENERLGLMARLEPVRWYATTGDAGRIATAVLQTKAVTFDLLLAQPPEMPADVNDPFADLLKPASAAKTFLPYERPPPVRPPKIASGDEHRTAPPAMRREPAGTRPELFTITPSQVCRALPKGTALVEIVRYKHYVGRFQDELRYGALVSRSRQSVGEKLSDQLAWIPLGAAEPIERELTALESEIRDPLAAGMVAIRLRTLHDLVWAPVGRALPADTENVFVCPDGQTCFLPFGALLDADKRFLGDKFLLMFLSTARDLFQFGDKPRTGSRDFTVFAAPWYGQVASNGTEALSRFRDVDARALSGLKLTDLPGSRAEAEALSDLASQQQLFPAVFLGDLANKRNVFALRQPRVVHFATHGFFLPAAAEGLPGNPMDRSGLALAGAHVTLEALAKGTRLPGAANDGLLTAREVARLPLAGTWIAALSACDTGRGEVRDGEGVLGLRRGFLAAGVQNLMITLWKISDHETVGFMRDFYARALATDDAATSLALTQREWLGRIRKERGIAAAVTTAGAFVLNTSGRLPLPAAQPETSGAAEAGVQPNVAEMQASTAQRLGLPIEQSNSIGMLLRLIPPGEFIMGSTEDDIPRLEEGNWFFAGWALKRMQAEFPRHKVRLAHPFHLGTHEVTVGQFREFVSQTGYKTLAERSREGGFGWTTEGWQQRANFNWLNPGFPQSDAHPVGNVAWEDANEFCNWLSKLEGRKYRLPTEAEWEYACRAGTTTWFHSGDDEQGLKLVANIADHSLRLAHPEFEWPRPWNDGYPFTAPVGEFAANAFGLHDMHGNVWEWCLDNYDPGYYRRSPTTDPLCREATPYHVFRGGGWDNYPGFCRSADRYSSHSPSLRTVWAGFRIVMEVAAKQE